MNVDDLRRYRGEFAAISAVLVMSRSAYSTFKAAHSSSSPSWSSGRGVVIVGVVMNVLDVPRDDHEANEKKRHRYRSDNRIGKHSLRRILR
jgi:hypothetical protein